MTLSAGLGDAQGNGAGFQKLTRIAARSGVTPGWMTRPGSDNVTAETGVRNKPQKRRFDVPTNELNVGRQGHEREGFACSKEGTSAGVPRTMGQWRLCLSSFAAADLAFQIDSLNQ